ncbi:MAG: hypothetical protein ACRD3H_13560 [Terriglobales bacterium]
MKRAAIVPLAAVGILSFGIVGAVIFVAVAGPKPPSILLKWNAPAPKPGITIASYEIFRSQGSGAFEPLVSGVKTPTYVDHDVIRGNTYNYYVRAVDTQGNVSPPSNQAIGVIP